MQATDTGLHCSTVTDHGGYASRAGEACKRGRGTQAQAAAESRGTSAPRAIPAPAVKESACYNNPVCASPSRQIYEGSRLYFHLLYFLLCFRIGIHTHRLHCSFPFFSPSAFYGWLVLLSSIFTPAFANHYLCSTYKGILFMIWALARYVFFENGSSVCPKPIRVLS